MEKDYLNLSFKCSYLIVSVVAIKIIKSIVSNVTIIWFQLKPNEH